MPTMLSLAIPSTVEISFAPSSFTGPASAFCAFGSSSLLSVKEMSFVSPRVSLCTIMSMLMFAPASALKIFAAVPGWSGNWRMVTLA